MKWHLITEQKPSKNGEYLVVIRNNSVGRKNKKYFCFPNEWSEKKQAFSYDITMSEKAFSYEKIYAWCEIPAFIPHPDFLLQTN